MSVLRHFRSGDPIDTYEIELWFEDCYKKEMNSESG